VTRATVPETEDVALESLEEHHIVKWVLSELEDMDPEHERFDAKVTVLIENVRHHVKEEEEEYFPKVRDELGRKALADVGEAMEAAKKTAPTHPHPRSPDAPPGNLVAGTAAGVVDRVGDTASGAVQGGTSVIADLVATVLGRKKPRRATHGSPAARKTATTVRATGANVTESVIDAVRSTQRKGQPKARAAKQGASKTAKTATPGTKATAVSARQSAAPTSTTAKRTASTTKRPARKATGATRSARRRPAR
jgi:hypothetical protein